MKTLIVTLTAVLSLILSARADNLIWPKLGDKYDTFCIWLGKQGTLVDSWVPGGQKAFDWILDQPSAQGDAYIHVEFIQNQAVLIDLGAKNPWVISGVTQILFSVTGYTQWKEFTRDNGEVNLHSEDDKVWAVVTPPNKDQKYFFIIGYRWTLTNSN